MIKMNIKSTLVSDDACNGVEREGRKRKKKIFIDKTQETNLTSENQKKNEIKC